MKGNKKSLSMFYKIKHFYYLQDAIKVHILLIKEKMCYLYPLFCYHNSCNTFLPNTIIHYRGCDESFFFILFLYCFKDKMRLQLSKFLYLLV